MSMVAVLTPATGVLAADLDDAIRQEAGITPVEYGSGWYLRGDIGTFHSDGTVSYNIGGPQDIVGSPFFDTVSVGVGVGYIFNENLRADFTISHIDEQGLSGSSALGGCGAGYTGECFYSTSANFDYTDISLNGYWDFASYGNIKPYVGAGLGLVLVRWDNYNSQAYCVLDPGETCAGAVHSGGLAQETPAAGAAITSHGRSTLASFSFATGAGYRLSDYWSLDFGYKFTHLFDVGLNSNTGNLAEIDNMNVHEIRAGLRYEIW